MVAPCRGVRIGGTRDLVSGRLACRIEGVSDWTRLEVEATVSDYLAMLEAERRGEAYNKSEHRRALSKLLNQRTDTAIERKHQNISAILIELGVPPVEGYKPLFNYQQLLCDVVHERVRQSPGLLAAVAADIARPVTPPTIVEILKTLVAPPKPAPGFKQHYPRVLRERKLRRLEVDYLALEAANRELGAQGEEFVVRYEQARLVAERREDLAAKVERVSMTRGPGAGFDVLSFEGNGRELLIEVKTTAYGPYVPFFVTRNELFTSRENADRYHLYRVYGFRRAPLFFKKRGELDHTFDLDPVHFEARIA
jgi:hypothetical protein